jgi:hypothetical protein
MNATALAGSLPRNAQFRAWVEHISVPLRPITPTNAAEFIRVVCQVDSRRELATNAAAEERFHQHVRRPFVAWRDSQFQP